MRINVDLMFGLPGQLLAGVCSDIKQAVSFDVSHLSVYQLTLEPNTQFAHTPPALPDSDQLWEMQEQAQQLLSSVGFEQYEVSAYSRNSACQHNLNYWRFGDYLAIGAGAHGKLSAQNTRGKLKIKRFWNHRHPTRYMQAMEDGNFAADAIYVVKQDRDFEYLMNALRLKAGFELDQYQQRTGGHKAQLVNNLQPFMQKRWLVKQGDLIRPTKIGYRYIDSILLACLPDKDHLLSSSI